MRQNFTQREWWIIWLVMFALFFVVPRLLIPECPAELAGENLIAQCTGWMFSYHPIRATAGAAFMATWLLVAFGLLRILVDDFQIWLNKVK